MLLGLSIFFMMAGTSIANESTTGESGIVDSTSSSVEAATELEHFVDTTIVIKKLDFSGVLIREALTALARNYGVSIFIDTSVTGDLTMRLENVSLDDAFRLIISENDLNAERVGATLKISKLPTVPPAPPRVKMSLSENKITIDAKKVPIQSFVEDFTELTRVNVTLKRNVSGTITGNVVDLDVKTALHVLLETNDYLLTEKDGVFVVELPEQNTSTGGLSRRYNVRHDDGIYSIDVDNADLATTIAALFSLTGANLSLQTKLSGKVSATVESPDLVGVLGALLKGSAYSYKQIGALYVIGEASSSSLQETRLITLKNLSAETVEKLLPASLMKGLSQSLYKEQNGILVTGPATRLDDVAEFIRRADLPPAQVLFDVLVVEYSKNSTLDYGLGITKKNSSDTKDIYYPEIDFDYQHNLKDLGKRLGITNLGRLTDKFFVRLSALAQDGKAKVIQRPQIAALNGHTASIAIGTTQYFLLDSKTVYPSAQTDVSTQTSQRFETIEANISLEVTPHVTDGDEVIVDIKPEFNTPAGQGFDPDVPPTINKRVLESTVNLRNGETIVLGGIVNSTESVSINKLPLLGDIPLLGKLFQNRNSTKNETELMIYITPHVYYGSEGSIDIQKVL